MLGKLFKILDWFIPAALLHERSEREMARNFVFTHLSGPLLCQSISVFLYQTDPHPGFACWTIMVCVCLFWTLPFGLKYTEDLKLSAFLSAQLLAFTSLFGTFFYGGVGSPFLPWFLVALLLGFFYLSDRPVVVINLFAANIAVLVVAYITNGFPELVPLAKLETVGWISIFSATVYMSWMAIYYANVMSMRSEVEREMERHRVTAENLRDAKERADAANHAKSIFLAKMSHEFRTPLNAVIGYSELMLETLGPDGGDEQKLIDLRRINAAGKHLLSLVTDVLDMSKIESAKLEINRETFSVDSLLDQVVATAQPLAAANSNRFVLQRHGPLGIITTDQTKLRQVVLNLLSNAAKFTDQGTITLGVRCERKSAGDWLELQVLDTGIGIAQSDISKLFQDFRQLSASASINQQGTGLGLALSQKLSALLGGAITVTSERGRGSCFTVRIPAGSATQMANAAPDLPNGDYIIGRAELAA